MAVYTVLTDAQLSEALAAFGLPPPDRVRPEPRGGVNTNLHVWAGGRRWFLRLAEGKGDEDVRWEAEVQRFLRDAGYPVPELVPARDGAPCAVVAGRPAMLFAYAPGEEVGLRRADPARCRRVGEQLGRLHDLAAAFQRERPNPYGPARVRGWLDALGADGGGDTQVAAALPVLREELARAEHLPAAPRGLVHGDLFVDNVLWIGDRVGAILDWEMSCVDAFAYDLAVAVNAWCYADAYVPERAAALAEGYRARRRIDRDTAAALPAWARWAALRFTASRIAGYHRAALGPDRLARKDWRRYRDRLAALRQMGDAGFRALLGI